MRLKTTPEDFRVRELLEWNEVPDGNFVVHRLQKEKMSTPEALAILTRDAKTCTGNFFIDEDVLKEAGVTDLTGYAMDPDKELLPDLFL